jgi:DNA-binding NarL/FixJ family response regulator
MNIPPILKREEIYMAGQALNIEPHVPAEKDLPGGPLTRREVEVLTLVANGKTTKQVAAVLGMAVKTAICHRGRILNKLGIHNTADLTRYAIRMGLIAV